MRAFVRCEQGSRRRIEDAWSVEFDVPFAGRRVHLFAVFDGLGGEPRGQEAAHAASQGARRAVEASAGPGDVLRRLNEDVLSSRGYTTVVAAVIPVDRGADGWLLHAGDSAAYARVSGEVRLLTQKDSALDGAITDFLGNPRLRGHVTPLPSDDALLLCTDGVDGVVSAQRLEPLLRARPDDVEATAAAVFDEIRRAGEPDNATVVWFSRDA